jgi:gluconolactonase
MKKLTLFATALIAALCVSTYSEENKLSDILIDGEDWQLVGEGYGFADGSCADAAGNVYFSDMPKGIIYKIDSASGKVEPFIENVPKISGMKWAPDGRLICCQNGAKKIVAFDSEKKLSVLAENISVNDLIVSKTGNVYFTGVAGKVMRIDPKGQVTEGAKDLGSPNGISLSPDQKTLAVSDYKGVNVFTLKVADDGSLSDKAAPMTMKTPTPAEGKPAVSGGDGMTTDVSGRYFVTSHLGIQVFQASGMLLGIIERPQAKPAVNVAFGGPDMSVLFVCNADKVFKRKTKTKGMVFYK